MDLNIIVYKDKCFDSKVIIKEKLKRAIDCMSVYVLLYLSIKYFIFKIIKY